MTLPGACTLPESCGFSGLAASGWAAAALASAFTASTLGSSDAAGPNREGSDIEGSGMEGSDTGASTAGLVSAAEAVTASPDGPAEWEIPVVREPVSPPVCSAAWSLMVKSP